MNYNKINNNIYLGSYDAIFDISKSIKTNLYIITVANFDEFEKNIPSPSLYRPISFKQKSTDIKSIFDEIADFIHTTINENNDNIIFIHCYEGVSRSASCLVYYFMKYNHMTFTDAYSFVKENRPTVNIADYLIHILTDFV